MSTSINITVGDSGLLDRAKQQQSASRQTQLNREAATQLEAQATAARTTAFAAQGRDASGNLIIGRPFRQPQIDRRPAANRRGGLVQWLVTPTDAQLTAQVRNIKPFALQTPEAPNQFIYPVIFSPAGGPGGRAALEGTPRPNTISSNFAYTFNFLEYFKEPNLQSFTCEALVNIWSDNQYRPERGIRFGLSSVFGLFIGTRWTFPPLSTDPSLPFVTVQTVYFGGNGDVFNSYAYAGPALEYIDLPGAVSLPILLTKEWIHLAIVQSPGNSASTRKIALYADGQLIGSHNEVVTSYYDPKNQPFLIEFEYRNYDGNDQDGFTSTAKSGFLHGIRFTERALYSGASFTPPTSITTLA
jgi:hypothetical protein